MTPLQAPSSQKNAADPQSVPESPVSVPTENTYFHDVFSDAAELQFDVDVAAGSPNVTRLERMVRETDASVSTTVDRRRRCDGLSAQAD
jgi:hypothetical protein